jgi:hypothetical protein
VLLDRRDAVDALVIGIGVVLRGEQALDLCNAELLQRLQAKMAVQEKPGAGIRPIRHDDRRFDKADRLDGTQYLQIRSAFLGAVRQRLERNDRRDGDRQEILLEGETNTPVLLAFRFVRHGRLLTRGFERPGMVASPSALNRLMKPSLESRSFSASTTNSSRVWVKSDFLTSRRCFSPHADRPA